MNADRDHIDSALDALLRAHSTDMPSREVEGAILAAAHRAVQSTPRSAEAPRPWRRWMPLAAAATIAAITVGVLQLSPKSGDTTAAVVTDAPQVASEAPPATARADRVEEAPAANVQAQRAPALAKSSSAD